MAAGQYSVTSSFGGGTGVGPFLVPATLTAGTAIDVYVVGPVAAGAPSGGVTLPSVSLPAPMPSTQSIFTLSIYPAAGGAALAAAQVSVTTDVWSADPAKRAVVALAFKTFRAQLEALETAGTPVLLRGASDLIVNRLASALPLRFDEILPFYYAFDATAQSIDLLPGMSLRVDWAGYQYCDGPGGTGAALNGFATTGTSNLEIVRRPDATLAFDGFSAQFAQGVTLQPPSSCPVLAGGPVDLQLLGNGRRHLRLVWPKAFADAGSLDNGGTYTQMSCILLGAASFADMEAATAAVVAGGTGCSTQAGDAPAIVSIAFTGRVTVVPEIWVWIAGAYQRVPIGTTLRNVAQRFADPIPMQMQPGGGSPTNLQLGIQRWVQVNAPPMNAVTPTFDTAAITLGKAASVAGPLGDGFDTPLVKGDNVKVFIPGAN